MVQRLQLLAWPDSPRVWTSRDVHPDLPAKTRAFECYSRLATLDPQSVGAESPSIGSGARMPYLRFADDAVDLFLDWRTNILEPKVRGDDLTPQFAAHLSKYRGLVPRLALIHHLASGDTGRVSRRAVLAALAWAEYLEAHAARAYASLTRAETDVASAIMRRIRKGDLKNGFTDRDVYRNGWSGLTNRESVGAGLKLLEDYDWLASERLTTGGRPSTVWYINPSIVD